MGTISIPFPNLSINPTPLQLDALEHACWQMEAMNAIFEASFLPPVKKSIFKRADVEKESVSDETPEMRVPVDLLATDDVKCPVSPTFSVLGCVETAGSDGSCSSQGPTYDEGSSLSSPNNITLFSRENSKMFTFSCFASVRKILMALPDAMPLQRRDVNKPSTPSPLNILSPPSTHAANIREEENVGVRRVKRKPIPVYPGDSAALGKEPSLGQCLHPGPTSSASRPCQRLLTPLFPKEGLNFGDFELKKVLGYGGQGKVYLASFRGNLVAVKVTEKWKLGKDSAELRFVLQEQRVLRTLNSPFILSLEASFCDSSFFYLVTEYHEGGELHQALVGAGRFDECTARFYIAEMALGIDHLHKNGVIHRDIKLMNILIKKDGHIAIADMGLVLDLWSPTHDKEKDAVLPTCCGTVPYMSPEVLEGKSHGEAVDLWALGVCSYLMLTGSLPWHGAADKDTILMILDDPVPFTKETPPNAAARLLVAQLLMKHPSLRLTMDDLYIHPFFYDTDWRALERSEVRPPFVPVDRRSSLARATLPAKERFTPGFPAPFFMDRFPEYTYIKSSSTVPLMKPSIGIVTPVATLPASMSARARNQRPLPSSPAPSSSPQLLVLEQPSARLAKQIREDILVSIQLATSARHRPQTLRQSGQDHGYPKGSTQPRLFKWLLGLGRHVVRTGLPPRSAQKSALFKQYDIRRNPLRPT